MGDMYDSDDQYGKGPDMGGRVKKAVYAYQLIAGSTARPQGYLTTQPTSAACLAWRVASGITYPCYINRIRVYEAV